MMMGGDTRRTGSPRPASPQTLDVSAAARLVLVAERGHGVLTLWEHLTGLTGEAALTYARIVVARQTTAVLPPF